MRSLLRLTMGFAWAACTSSLLVDFGRYEDDCAVLASGTFHSAAERAEVIVHVYNDTFDDLAG